MAPTGVRPCAQQSPKSVPAQNYDHAAAGQANCPGPPAAGLRSVSAQLAGTLILPLRAANRRDFRLKIKANLLESKYQRQKIQKKIKTNCRKNAPSPGA